MLVRLVPAALGALLIVACGSSASAPASSQTGDPSASVAAGRVRDWPMFGVGPGRSNDYRGAAGVTPGNVHRLRRARIHLPGTVDASPIFLHGVRVGGRRRDVVVMTTTYGRTLALAAYSGRRLWTYTPRGYASWAGSAQITNATPAADRRFVYAAAPDGFIHKLSLASGRPVRAKAWPVRVTRLPGREKLPSALALFGRFVLATTDGYIGDAPPYQAHYVAIDRSSGRRFVFNSLCSERRGLQTPSTCPESGGAMFGRGSPVVDARARLVWTATGNARYDGRRYWGDSVLGLSLTGRLRKSFTPANHAFLEANDVDLGSAAPALLPGGVMLQGGKEGKLFVLDRRRPSGHATAGRFLGGALQTLATPGHTDMFTTAAVAGGRVFVTTSDGIAAYAVRHRRLHRLWSHARAGTSPVVAGGLVWVYDPGGALVAYGPRTGRTYATLPAGGGHWNSPIVAARHVWLPEGNANEHARSGVLDIYRLP